jgi:hypothetical protein
MTKLSHPQPPEISRLQKILTATAVLALTAAQSSAALIAYEGFDYTAGTDVNGSNGGTGWASAWNNDTAGQWDNTSGSLSYGSLPTSGGKASLTANNASPEIQRTLSNPPLQNSPDAGTLWISWIHDSTAAGQFNQLRLGEGATPNNRVAVIGAHAVAPGSQTWRLYNGAFGSSVDSGIAMTGVQFVVVGINLATDEYRLYINPALGESAPGTPSASATFADTDTFDTLRYVIHSTTAAGDPGVDEIRVGTTFADVAAIPEPSVFGLLGLSTAGLALIRRR